jgi:3-hydroxy-9,10-secoandrosta-1,3,5(10)-triene-9,17-dione monooxygenase reductase component
MSDAAEPAVPDRSATPAAEIATAAATIAAAATAAAGPIDPQEFRRTMGRFATGVAVLTTVDAAGAPVGITVNSLSSVSLAPPLLLWSIDRRASCLPVFRAAEAFGVNLLPAGAAELCRRFSRRDPHRFSGVPYELGPLGMPLLQGMLAHLSCRVWARYPGGDHEIIVGEVTYTRGWDGDPLVFHQGRLQRFGAGALPRD